MPESQGRSVTGNPDLVIVGYERGSHDLCYDRPYGGAIRRYA